MKKEKVILMRDYLKGLLFITCSLILIPAIPLLVNRTSAEPKALPATVQIENIDTEYEYIDEVVVCDTVKQETFTLPTEDYLIAALRSQLAESTPKEAIKAQAMVLYTYILGRRLEEMERKNAAVSEKAPDPEAKAENGTSGGEETRG